MFEWLKFIGEFFLGLLTGIDDFIVMMSDAYVTVQGAILAAPSFLHSIMTLMLAAVVIMWVVNLL